MEEYDLIDFNKYLKKTKIKKLDFNNKNNDFIIVDLFDNCKRNDKLNPDEKIERIIYFDFNNWLTDMYNSFKDNYDIEKQFILDYNRSVLFLNGNVIDTSKDFLDYIYIYHQKYYYKILMCCTQTIMAIPFEIIQNELEENNYLAEYKLKKNLYISVISDKKNNKIILRKEMRIIKIINHDAYTTGKVKINILVDFKKNNIVYKIKYKPLVLK